MKAFVIRKPNDEMSEKFADECIASAKHFGVSVEKFDGVYSDHDEIIKSKGLFFFEKMKEHRKTNPGIKGCFLSHFLLWEKCIALNEPIIIFEHDALMIRPLPPNFTDLFTHHCILDYAVHYPDYEEIIAAEGDLKVVEYPMRGTHKMFFSQINKHHVKGSHAHAVTPIGAKTLINSIKKYGMLPSDMCVNQFYTAYVTIDPLIARCHPFFSDSSNRQKYGHIR
jgi:GR25 family glycosyltransferase involved in LPS biosynthesis